MTIPSQFDKIRPFEPEELPGVYNRLLDNPQFKAVLTYLFPQVPFAQLAEKFRACHTSLDFQKHFSYVFLQGLMAKMSTGLDMDASAIDNTQRYTFVSNHRDIVLDSALLSKLLLDAGFTTTCEIAIGDNLLSLPWVKDLARLNKAFIVERSVGMREMLISSKRLSEYMHFAIAQKHENIWIAQREGRAKDSDDHTQTAVLKMMAMGGEGTLAERLVQLHIVPLAISYEYDPCDYLKARELQQRRDTTHFQKGPMEDVDSMRTGIMGYKGRVHYHCAPCIDAYLESLDPDMPKNLFFDDVAAHIDSEIHRNYRLYANNYIAADLLENSSRFADKYTAEDKKQFENYLQAQLEKIELPNKDTAFLTNKLLTMYANPLFNQLKALGQ